MDALSALTAAPASGPVASRRAAADAASGEAFDALLGAPAPAATRPARPDPSPQAFVTGAGTPRSGSARAGAGPSAPSFAPPPSRTASQATPGRRAAAGAREPRDQDPRETAAAAASDRAEASSPAMAPPERIAPPPIAAPPAAPTPADGGATRPAEAAGDDPARPLGRETPTALGAPAREGARRTTRLEAGAAGGEAAAEGAADAERTAAPVAPRSPAAAGDASPGEGSRPAPPAGSAERLGEVAAAPEAPLEETAAAVEAPPEPRETAAQAAEAPEDADAPRREAPAAARQVAQALLDAGGRDRLELRLDPPELGRVSIDLQLGPEGSVSAAISAERPETLDMLRRHVESLQRELAEAGFGRADLSFSDRGPGRDGSGRRGFAVEMEDGPAASVPAAGFERSPLRVAPSERLDIRL